MSTEPTRESVIVRKLFGRLVIYSRISSWGEGSYPRFGAWKTAHGAALRYRIHLFHLRWRRA